ncbi:hypothetical protein T484DRAFT_1885825, partial [Baffinella frigidus]
MGIIQRSEGARRLAGFCWGGVHSLGSNGALCDAASRRGVPSGRVRCPLLGMPRHQSRGGPVLFGSWRAEQRRDAGGGAHPVHDGPLAGLAPARGNPPRDPPLRRGGLGDGPPGAVLGGRDSRHLRSRRACRAPGGAGSIRVPFILGPSASPSRDSPFYQGRRGSAPNPARRRPRGYRDRQAQLPPSLPRGWRRVGEWRDW